MWSVTRLTYQLYLHVRLGRFITVLRYVTLRFTTLRYSSCDGVPLTYHFQFHVGLGRFLTMCYVTFHYVTLFFVCWRTTHLSLPVSRWPWLIPYYVLRYVSLRHVILRVTAYHSPITSSFTFAFADPSLFVAVQV